MQAVVWKYEVLIMRIRDRTIGPRFHKVKKASPSDWHLRPGRRDLRGFVRHFLWLLPYTLLGFEQVLTFRFVVIGRQLLP